MLASAAEAAEFTEPSGVGSLGREVSDALGSSGAFARLQPGFSPRAGQIEMAVAVAQAIASKSTLVAEAGTGVGKTYAYLVPALLSGERVVVSTATKALQDQLFGRDLPHVLRALGLPTRTAMLKGRPSYLCTQRLQEARQNEPRGSPHEAGLAEVQRWAQTTRTGDLAELPHLDERSGLVSMVSSTRDNCLGATCPQVRACHVNQARRAAMGADIVVVNHHLLFADMAVREAGVAELLPGVGVVVVDEAHQLNDIGLQFLGDQWGSAALRDLARDLLQIARPAALGMGDWNALAAALEACALQMLQLVRGAGTPGRFHWSVPADGVADVLSADANAPAAAAHDDSWTWAEHTPPDAGSPQGVDPYDWRIALAASSQCLHECAQALEQACEAAPSLRQLADRCGALCLQADLFAAPADAASVRWMELTRDAFRLIESPHDVGASLRTRLMRQPAVPHTFASRNLPGADCDGSPGGGLPEQTAWIFTSATLGDDKSLDWFTEPCGLKDARTLRVASPFNYATQAALYVPADAPAPADGAHSPWVAALAARAALTLGGRTLVLTTTLKALRIVGDLLRAQLSNDSSITVLVQGEMPKRWLMERFRAGASAGTTGCVLVASASFWEGFDVPGESLQLVIIDKLPFPPPGDPLVVARMQRMESAGRSAFAHHAVPEAAVALRQGAGRLIRNETDRGILVVCDQRLVQKGYGKRLLRALPAMRRLEDAQAFERALTDLLVKTVATGNPE